jgi:hypothetical protein
LVFRNARRRWKRFGAIRAKETRLGIE